MALSNLRTGISVIQRRNTVSPNVRPTTLPVGLIGLNRDLFFQSQASLFDWSAGTVATNVGFPGYVSGRVEAGVSNPHLVPRFFVRSTLGTAEITDKVTLNNIGSGATGAPSFSISSGFSAVFSITSGTEGCFKANPTETLSSFEDTSADFVFSQVKRGDSIVVQGVTEYQVTGIVSDTELDVRRVGKGPESAGNLEAAKLRLTPEDTNDLRKLISTSSAFEAQGGFGQSGTKVKAGDILRVDNWDTKTGSAGLVFSALGENEGTVLDLLVDYTLESTDRLVKFPALGLTMQVFDPATGLGTVLFTADVADNFVPAMYLTSTEDTGAQVAAATFATSPLSPTADSDMGSAYQAATYSALGVPITSSLGSFSVESVAGLRTFTDVHGLFTVGNISVSGSNAVHILIKDSDGVLRPAFNVTARIDDNNVTVEEFTPGSYAASVFANNVEYVAVTVDTALPSEFEVGGTSSVSATYGDSPLDPLFATDYVSADYGLYVLTSEDRILSGTGITFPGLGTPVVAGDFIFSDSGILMFQVVAVPTAGAFPDRIVVKLANDAGTVLSPAGTLSNFGFTIRVGNQRSDFVVRRVVSDTELEVSAIPSSPNTITGTMAVQGMVWYQDFADPSPVLATSVTVADTTKGIPYSIEKTVSGASLTGDILVTYAVIKDGLIGLQEVTAANYRSVLGDDTPDNPLGLAARIYFQTASSNLFVTQVAEDSTAGWLAAAESVKTDKVYNIVPLTQDPSVLASWRAHVISESQPDQKRERVLWQSERFLRDQVRASFEDSDMVLVSRTNDGDQTLNINRDLLALGVEIGDDFVGEFFNGSVTTEFSGRILDLILAGSTTTLTLLPDGAVLPGTVDMAVTSFTITQRPMSLAELKDVVKAYPSTVNERRIRNVYPDNAVVEFSDNTGDGETDGIYGGGNQLSSGEGGGEFMCVVEAAKRVTYGPATPLTKRGGAGIFQILDSFAEAPGFQDELVDSGHYYMEQLGGLGTNIRSLRALTTDVRELILVEESVTPQIDSFVRSLRAGLNPLLGPNKLDERFYDLMSTTASAIVSRTLRNKGLKEIRLISIAASPTAADTIVMNYSVVPFFSGARAEVVISF